MSLRVGVDTGGTFTDICVLDEDTGRLHVRKVPSTPEDPGSAIITAVEHVLGELGKQGLAEVGYFAHGTTVGTNTLLTERGARTAVITTRGFRDLLELGRGRRPSLYDLQRDKPAPLVPRELRFEVGERVRHDGRVEQSPSVDEVRALARQLDERNVEAVAVCLLYSFVRPEHEELIARVLRAELPDVYVSLSSEVLPEFREFERLSTVTVNAYLGPVVARYLSRLRGRLSELGLPAAAHVTQSNGGIIPFETAERVPARMVLSGPSTGVVGAAEVAAAAGYPDLITFDVGGTSSDVSLVRQSVPRIASGTEIDGRPVKAPMLDVHTVGAGGGSIAWIDSGDALKVGPHSASADPGPACYGRGNQPTVTDANVVLQVLNPQYLLGGDMAIDAQAAHAAVKSVAEPLELSVQDAAQGVIRIVTANMARAIRVISVQRGYDPRDYVLMAYGGAGPLHAARLARELDMTTVLVPLNPGAQCAAGLLMTDIRADFLRSTVVDISQREPDGAAAGIADIFDALETQAQDWLAEEAISPRRRRTERTIEMRYAGQNYELPVAVPAGRIGTPALLELSRLFALEHERMYGYQAPEGEALQAVTFRVRAIGEVARAELARAAVTESPPAEAVDTRSVYLPESGGWVRCPVFDRSRLLPGQQVVGPAVVEQLDATTLLLPHDTASVDDLHNLVMEVGT